MPGTNQDDPLSLAAAAKLFDKPLGITPSRTTIYRWVTQGVRGVVLWTYLMGGRRATTRRAILNFLREINEGTLEFDPELIA